VSGLSPPKSCVLGVDHTNESAEPAELDLDDALVLLHPAWLDSAGGLHVGAL
jgi:hypothetical protein